MTVLWDPLDIQYLLLGVISGWNANVVWDEKEGSLHTIWCFPRCVPCTLDSRHVFVAATWTWKAFFHKCVLLLLCFCSLLLGTWQSYCYCFGSPQMLSIIKERVKWKSGCEKLKSQPLVLGQMPLLSIYSHYKEEANWELLDHVLFQHCSEHRSFLPSSYGLPACRWTGALNAV